MMWPHSVVSCYSSWRLCVLCKCSAIYSFFLWQIIHEFLLHEFVSTKNMYNALYNMYIHKFVKRQTTATGPSTVVANDAGLHLAYTTPSLPGSFGALQNLKRYGCESYVDTVRYLSKQDAYTLHKQRRIRFPRRKTYTKGIGDLYQADLYQADLYQANSPVRGRLASFVENSRIRQSGVKRQSSGRSRDTVVNFSCRNGSRLLELVRSPRRYVIRRSVYWKMRLFGGNLDSWNLLISVKYS